MDVSAILEKFSFYREASPSFQATVAATASYASLPQGAYFYREGDLCSHFAMVGAGGIRVLKATETGQEITLYHVQEGEPCLVNMLCVFLNRPVMATAVVEVPTEAVIVPAAVFQQWVESNEAVRNFVFETMASRVIDVMVLVEELAFRKMDNRLARLLLQRFTQRERPLRVISTTHEELAAELGTAREVVSRLLKEFERIGAVRIGRGRVELLDETILGRLAQGS